ncbi:DUF29 family protein [Thiocapsa sp.]|uniref:DUF29 family protein n=1 Tax=Thiocapsa sp. TaxID=2024551 RepID=UPI0025D1E89A|nr:DUF29 family protein [Thiocapsa sp.]
MTESAALLREGCLSEVDLAQIAEELEDMGRSERRAIENGWAGLGARCVGRT